MVFPPEPVPPDPIPPEPDPAPEPPIPDPEPEPDIGPLPGMPPGRDPLGNPGPLPSED